MAETSPLLSWYQELLTAGSLTPDPQQEAAVRLLSDFRAQLLSPPRKFFARRVAAKQPKGIYLFGSVGRGKTLLMDGFFLSLPPIRKKRVHFHAFMRHFHQEMQEHLNNQQDGLKLIARQLAKECEILCFDEFHIADIADAMIMARLLEELLGAAVKLVMTSNYHPEKLYPNGLARHLFLPAIQLLMANMKCLDLSGEKDYRQLSLATGELYLSPADEVNRAKLEAMFAKIACSIKLEPQVVLQGRKLTAVRRTSDAIWFDFATICEAACSKLDYLRLAERFNTIFLSGVPQLNQPKQAAAARRFTWLVDILYDRKLQLVIEAAVPLPELYGKGGQQATALDESGRTLSRLTEMGSANYKERLAV